ncbi:MAG: hypothetical protein AB2A00_08870 [Myxococcota bacterium]
MQTSSRSNGNTSGGLAFGDGFGQQRGYAVDVDKPARPKVQQGGTGPRPHAAPARRSLAAPSPFVDGFERKGPPPMTPRPVEASPPGALSSLSNQFMKRFFNTLRRANPGAAQADNLQAA